MPTPRLISESAFLKIQNVRRQAVLASLIKPQIELTLTCEGCCTYNAF